MTILSFTGPIKLLRIGNGQSFCYNRNMKKYGLGVILLMLLVFQTRVSASQKKLPADYQSYVGTLKQTQSEGDKQLLAQLLKSQVKSLQDLGWSQEAICKVYLKKPSAKVVSSKLSQTFKERFEAIQSFGSEAFQQMWSIDGSQINQKKARHLLGITVKTVGMPSELSGSKEETAKLISHFSDDLEPNADFWGKLSEVVQAAFPKRSLAHEGSLQRQVHQLRYIISAQQAQWVRDEYRKTEMTDAQALSYYMKDMDEMNGILEKIGVDKSDYYYDYNFGESSRLHNKMVIKGQSFSNLKLIYPDSKNQVNFKIVMSFYTEFILDEAGHFVNELDPEGTNENGIINGASFNYANENNKLHRHLDVYPVLRHDPQFRKAATQNYGAAFKAPNRIKYSRFTRPHKRWENSYFNSKGYYAQKGLSRFKRVKKAIRAYKKLVERRRHEKEETAS